VAEYAWDLDGDAQFDDFFGVETTLVFNIPYSGAIGLQVADSFGAWSVTSEYLDITWTYVDFAAEGLTVDPNPALSTEPVHIDGWFSVDADAGHILNNVQLQYYLDGVPHGGTFIYNNLQAGAVMHAELDLVPFGEAGFHNISFVLDEPELHAEYDETNNQTATAFEIQTPAPNVEFAFNGTPDLYDWDFGCLLLGDCEEVTITATNTGNTQVELTAVNFDPEDDPAFSLSGPSAGTLEPGGEFTWEVEFCPLQERDYNIGLELTFDFASFVLGFTGCGESLITAVELDSFNGETIPGGARIFWSTPPDATHLGYHVLRSSTAEGEYQIINEQFIEVNPEHQYEFTDLTAPCGELLYYRIRVIRLNGRVDDSPWIAVETGEALPTAFTLHPNYPNPFNPSTQITVGLPVPGRLTLSIYNALGNEVAVLARGEMPAGNHHFTWEASNEASGVYLLQAKFKNRVLQRKMLLLR
jgi:hypothetical protein